MGKFDDALRMAIRPRNASQVSACETVLMQEFVHVLTGEDPRDGEYCMSQLLRFVDALQGMPADLYVGTWRMLSLYVEHPSDELLDACEGDFAHADEAIDGVLGSVMAIRHAGWR